MKFTLDSRDDINLIRGYGSGEVRIGEQVVRGPCIVTADRLITDWSVRDAATLAPEDLAPILELAPDVVLLGTGPKQLFPADAVRRVFAVRNIGLEVMDLGAACRTYNILVQEERRVAAALLPLG